MNENTNGQGEQSTNETFKAKGGQVIDKVKELIHEGNVRRITIKQEERVVAEFPLTVGVVGALIAPMLAALGALAALLTECTIEIERTDAGSGGSSSDEGQQAA
jgi:hypothetical protein